MADQFQPPEGLRKITHHTVRSEVAPGVWVVARPLRDTSPWHQWRRQQACRREIGHCWHPEGIVDWWCCECSAATDGMPPQRCASCVPEPVSSTGEEESGRG